MMNTENTGSTPFRRLRRNKRGVSSLFTTIYIALLAVLLISVLFVGLGLSSSGTIEYLKLEQERSLESIRLFKLTTDRGNTIVLSVEVINTGAIPVRLKALYIDHNLICDPSDALVLGEKAYIRPKENVTIPLFQFDIPLTALNYMWTATTERGTRSSEKGIDLWGASGGSIYTPSKFYFGPLMIMFDLFHWFSEGGPPMSGWSIPKQTDAVTWRIYVTNVDNRSITITEDSSFTLVGNDNEPNSYLEWYVDPPNSTMTLIPGNLSQICYAWKAPYYESGTGPQGITKFSESITCKNFLTFTGYFTELDGITTTPFGQTVPFEAVLITSETMPAFITLTASPANIANDGTTYSTITAYVTDSAGRPVNDTLIDFYKTAGTLSASNGRTNASGIVQVNLTSTTQQTTAIVQARFQGIDGTCKVNFTPAAILLLTADPLTLPTGSINSTITVQLAKPDGTPVRQSGIDITVTITTWTGKSNARPTLTPTVAATDSDGVATFVLTRKITGGDATIIASASGLTSGTVIITIT